MLANLNGWHLLCILAVVLLVFGGAKLPGLAKGVGQSMRIFKSEARAMKDEAPESGVEAATVAPASEFAQNG